MATEIQVPVRLKVLQDSIADFQKILSNLQPNTNSWKSLNKLISQMSQEAQKLQAQLSTPFSSEKQFSQTERTIDKLEETAARVAVVMQSLKFSDIKLDTKQTEELEKFNKEINNIRDSYEKLKQETKEKLLSNDNNSSLLGNINSQILTKDFEEIESAVDQHVQRLNIKVEEQKKAFNKLKSNIELGEKATILTTSGKGLTREVLGDSIFDKYLSETEKGLRIKSWNNGVTKQALLTELEEMFNLTPGELQHLADKTINDINKAFQDMGKKGGGINIFSGIISRGNDSKKKEPLKNQEITELVAQLNEYKSLQEEISKLKTTDLDPVKDVNDGKIVEINTRMETLRQTILANISTTSGYKSAMASLSQQFPQLRSVLEATNAEFLKMQSIQATFNSLKTTITNFMGFTQVLNLTKRAIKEAANHIKELDTVMNKISIVTDMDTSDLWGQIDQYSKMAQTYGTTIKGAYEVSQIYYQQGLDTVDVLTLTNETLKLAKISGLDYASTTDYMTTALRGFKMEMSEAATVVDVYSNLAANTAVSQEELAVAMSKTASSMESVGSSFEETSAMIATIVAVTRESATNIGSALKSIASRYGELKSNPLTMKDSEGEDLVYNKVDAALQSVGITLKDTEGQFRNFTDVITELSEVWDQLESTQQRYIATQFAGNRQQSRFLALVSNKDLLQANLSVAENSEDVGTVQALKALDSLESKIEQVRVAYQQFYTNIGAENVWKSFLDITKSVINTLNGMPKLFDKIPIGAINAALIVIDVIKNLGQFLLNQIATMLTPALRAMSQTLRDVEPEIQSAGETWIDKLNAGIRSKLGIVKEVGYEVGKQMKEGYTDGMANDASEASFDDWLKRMSRGNTTMTPTETYKIAREMEATGILEKGDFEVLISGGQPALDIINKIREALYGTGKAAQSSAGAFASWASEHQKFGKNLSGLGSALNIISLAINTTSRNGKVLSGTFQSLGGAAKIAGDLIKAAGDASNTIPWAAIASGIIAIVNGITQIVQANSIEAKLEEFTKKAEELNNKSKELKVNYKTLQSSIDKYHELEKARYDSTEAAEEYQEAVNKIAEAYPSLIQSYTETGDVILNASAMENALASAREASAEATLRAAKAEADRAKVQVEKDKKDFYYTNDELDKLLNSWYSGGMYNDRTGNRVSVADAESAINSKTGKKYDDEVQIILREMSSAVEKQNIDEIFNLNTELNKVLSEADWSLSDWVQTELDKILSTASQIRSDNAIMESANQATVSAYVNNNYAGAGKLLEGNTSLLSLATNEIYNRMKKAGISDYTDSAIQNYANDVLSSVENIWNSLTDNQLSSINKILDNSDNYNKNDLEKIANEYNIQVSDWLYNIFIEKTIANRELIQKKIEQMQNKHDLNTVDAQKINNIINTGEMSLDQRKLMSAGLNQIQSLNKNGVSSDTFLDNFLNLYASMSKIPAAARNALIDQFINNGFTKEGLQKTLDYIKNEKIEGIDTSSLKNIIEDIVPNITLAIDTAMANLADNLDGIESLASNLQSGVKGSKLEKTIADIKKLGIKNISRNDFIQDGDKFVLNYKKLQEVINAVDNSYRNQLSNYNGELLDARQNLENNINDINAARTILGAEDFEKYYEFDKLDQEWVIKNKYDWDGSESDIFWDAIDTAYEKTDIALINYFEYLDSIKAELLKTAAWKHGDYSSLSTLGLDEELYGTAELSTAYNRIQTLAANPEQMTQSEYEQPDVINAVENYRAGINKMLNDLSKYGTKYVKEHIWTYEGIDQSILESELSKIDTENGPSLTEAIKIYAKRAQKTIAETNELLITGWTQDQDIGAQQDVSGLISGGGFTMTDLNSYLTKYKKDEEQDITQYIDNGQIVNEALAEVYELDEATGEFKQIETATLTDILTAWSNALGVTITEGSELYNQIVKQWTTDKITEADKNDPGKQASNVLSQIISGKVGARIDTSSSDEIEKILGTEASHIYEIASEFERDSMILALDVNTIDDTEWKTTVLDAQKNIKSKRNQGTALKNILTKSFDRTAANAYLISQNIDTTGWIDSSYDTIMSTMGWQWDEFTQSYKATIAAVNWANAQVQKAIDAGESEETIAELQLQANQLASELAKDPLKEAIASLVSNYSDVSQETIDQLSAQLTAKGSQININDYISEVEGKKQLDVEGLSKILPEYAYLFNDAINSLIDEYINNASKAEQLVSSGTNSMTDMDAFTKAYNKMMKLEGEQQKTSTDLFSYNTILKSWSLDPSVLQAYVRAQANALAEAGKLDPTQIEEWIKSQTTGVLAQNINISDFLSAEDKSSSSEAYKKLAEQMHQYWVSIGRIEADATSVVNQEMQNLITGGQAAVGVIERWAEKQGRTATAEEIESAFNNAINELDSAMDALAEVSVGQITTGKLKEILQKAGKVDSNGVVTSVENMASVYENIYREMKNTAGATTAGLNSAYAKVLTTKEQSDIDAITAMGDAFGMTYDTLGELISKTGESLEQWMSENSNLFESIGGGKIRITDFTAFSENRGWKAGSEEYTSAFKAYNDSLIEYNKKVSDQIKNEFNALTEIDLSQGEAQVNLTRIAEAGWSDNLEQLANEYGAAFKDGILTLFDDTDLSGFVDALGKLGIEAGDLLESETQAISAQLKTKKSADFQSAFKNIASNYDSINIEMIKALAKSLDTTFSEIEQFFVNNNDGTYKTTLDWVQALANTYQDKLTEATIENITNIITNEYDSILSSFESTTKLVTNGTISITDMQSFTQKFNKLTSQSLEATDLFNYDEELNIFKLNSQYLEEYANAQRNELEKLGLSGDAINDYLKDTVETLLQQNVDVTSFLNAVGKDKKQQQALSLIDSIKDLKNYKDIASSALSMKKFDPKSALEQTFAKVNATEEEAIIQVLQNGGEQAVELVKQMKGKQVTADELQLAYNASIDPLRNAIQDFSKGVGETVSGISIDIMEMAGYQLQRLDDGTAIITSVSTSVEGMVSAYLAIYQQMSVTAGHTQTDLNNAYAQVLIANSKKNVDALETLQNASGMTYQAFADLLSQYNKDYETILKEDFVEDTGFGKIRITNFNKFADTMQWDVDSPEYMEAYNNWVNSMTELQNQPITIMNSVADNIKSLADARPGQAVNVSYLAKVMDWDSLQEGFAEKFAEVYEKYGASFENGILQLSEGVNIPGLISEITSRAAAAGKLLPEQLAELSDTIANMLSNISSLISGGISGNLNNSQALELNNWAKQQNEFKQYFENNSSLDFSRTAEGLKLSTDQAIKLYNVLNKIDAVSANKVLTDIMNNNGYYESAMSTLQRIRQLTTEMDKTTSSARREQYEEELAVAKEILAVRSTTEDSSFNFMSNSLPSGLNNPLNYWKNWITAMDTIKKSKKSGSMGYQDFYNIVTEMGRLADITGDAIKFGNQTLHNSQEAADLIALAASKLSNIKGEVKVDFKALAKMGVDFSTGAKDMNESIQKGIQQLAEGQVSMLDGMIALLEAVVAMEKLGDIDLDSDMTIDLNEIFQFEGDTVTGFTPQFETWKADLKKKVGEADSELGKLFNGLQIDGSSLYDMLFNWDKKNWNEAGSELQEKFSQALTAFYKAAASGDWDLSNYNESFKELLLQYLPEGTTLDLGDVTYYINGNTMLSFDWSNEDALKDFKKYVAEHGGPKGFLNADLDTVKAEVQKMLDQLNDNTISVEDKVEIQVALGLLNGTVTLAEKNKEGKWIGSYKGVSISADSESKANEQIKKAAQMDLEGFNVSVDAEGKVEGTIHLGKSLIKVIQNREGENQYEAYPAFGPKRTFNTKEKALAYMASLGEGTEGETYEFAGKTYTIRSDNKLGINYSFYKDKNGEHYVYHGKTFNSFSAMAAFVGFEENTHGEGEDIKINGKTFRVLAKGNTEARFDYSNGKVEYIFKDLEGKETPFASIEDYQNYLTAQDLADQDLLAETGEVKYNLNGLDVYVSVNSNGTLTYTTQFDGETATGSSEAQLRQSIAAIAALKGVKNPIPMAGEPNYTFTYKGAKITVVGGKIDNIEGEIDPAEKEKIEKYFENNSIDTGADGVGTATLNELKVTLADGVQATLDLGKEATGLLLKPIANATAELAKLTLSLAEGVSPTIQEEINIPTKLDGTAEASAESLLTLLQKIKNYKPTTKAKLTGEGTFKDNANAMKEKLDELASYDPVDISVILTGGGAIRGMVDGLISKVKELAKTWIITFEGQKTGDWPDSTGSGSDEGTGTGKGKEIVDPTQPHFIKATGNFGLAKSKGTLMGELGPELVVSNGRYFVVGQNGPEFVNLADDAIVFNHLQTKQLLDKGMSNTRGRAVTNERNAVAYAQGSVNGGPAMSSASEMLAYLKQLREMWKKLTDLSVKDLTSTGGGGGGGGGNKEFLKQVERWYNLLQKIAELEEKITYEEQRRKLLTVSGIKDGKAYYASLKQSLAAMKEQVEANAQLAREQEEYFNKRREELNKEGAFKSFYTFDERGQLQYQNFDKPITVSGLKTLSGKEVGKKTFTSAFELLNEINRKNSDGTSYYNTASQMELMARGMGFKDAAALRKKYKTYYEEDEKGKKVEKTRTDTEILEMLWKQMESDQSEMQSLHDSIKDYQKAVMEAQEKQAQIIKEMKDNQLAVEKDVYDAIVDMRERAIEEMRDLRDAYEDSTDKFITGLTNALDKERKMYETQQAESDLDKKRRRVAILQRTGGSGAEIASLQAEIESDEQDLYFEKQQQEIDAIQEAADKQIEKLDQQIELEEELLEYQKEHGLLWQDVSKIMRGTSDEIVSFITTNNSEWWAKSPLATAQDLEDALFKAEQWTQFRDDDGKYFEEILAAIQRVAEGKQPTEEDSTASEEQQQEYNKKEGSKSIEEKSKYKVTYTDGQGEQQTRYFRSQKWADEFKKTHKKDYKDIKVEKLGTKNYWIFAHKLNWQEGDEPEIFGPYNKEFATMKTQELKKSVYYDDKYIKMEQGKYNKKTKKYEQPKKPQGFSAGGLNTTTGLAMLHGTPEKPEAVFNAEQTEILRNKILSNKPTSLLSLLQSLQGAMATAANNTTNINRSAATEIGSIALNMNVSQIANDYDAKRAGEQAMTEMLRIARKTNVTAIRG